MYYGRATISEAVSCLVIASCYVKIGGMIKTFTASIGAGSTESSWQLVYESVPDPDLHESGCYEVSPTECNNVDIVSQYNGYPY